MKARGRRFKSCPGHFEKMKFSILRATEEDLTQIKDLSNLYNFKNISDDEKKKEGFVSLELSLDLLKQINNLLGILVIKINNKIIGYEIPLKLELADKINFLKPFIKRSLIHRYNDKPLNAENTVIEAQILINKNYKGKGLAEQLHKKFIEILRGKYSFIITEISDLNPRSLHFHIKKLGFDILEKYSTEGRNWYILIQKIN